MDLDLSGRVIVITGASAGIGRSTALALGAEGATVVLGARTAETLAATEEHIRDAGGEAFAVTGDLVTTDGAQALAETAIDRFGRIDGLVTSVGSTPLGGFTDVDDAVWHQAFEMKFLATVRAIRAVLPHLEATGSGRIVVVSGNTAHEPSPDMLTSGAINAALGSLVAGLSRHVAPTGIGVVAVAPGPVRTARYEGLLAAVMADRSLDREAAAAQVAARIPTGRVAEADDIGSLIAYLLSPLAAHITGTSVSVDGGQTWPR